MAKNLEIRNRFIRLQVWDTAGQETFKAITRSYYKNAACAFIVYDITDHKTFDSVKNWINECRELCNKKTLLVLVGNKIDLEEKRAVTQNEGKEFARENNLFFFETSALDGSQIKETFEFAVEQIVDNIEKGKIDVNELTNSGISIGNYPNKEMEEKFDKSNKGCC